MGGQLETCSLLPAHADVYDAVINDHSVAMRATEFKEPQVRLHWSVTFNPAQGMPLAMALMLWFNPAQCLHYTESFLMLV